MRFQCSSMVCYPKLQRAMLVSVLSATISFAVRPEPSQAISLTGDINNFLVIGTGSNSQVSEAVKIDGLELGAITGSSSDPTLSGNDLLPTNSILAPVLSGRRPGRYTRSPSYKGNIAVTHAQGTFQLSSSDIYADLGIRTEGGISAANKGLSGVRWDNAAGGSGLRTPTTTNGALASNSALMAILRNTISQFSIEIAGLAATQTFNAGGSALSTDTTINLQSGLNIIDLTANSGVAFELNAINFIINGPSDAYAIFRIANRTFKVNDSNIVRRGNIGTNNILFWSSTNQASSTAFEFSNAFFDAASFWSTGSTSNQRLIGGIVKGSNVRGCTQFVGSRVEMGNSRLDNCAFRYASPPPPNPGISIPTPALLPGLIGMGIAALRRHNNI